MSIVNFQQTTAFEDTFKLRKQLASGVGHTVWEAVHVPTSHVVVVKIYKSIHADIEGEYQHFEKRAANIRALDHPNVVSVLGYGQTDRGQPYWAMELLAGKTLEALLADSGRLSQERAINIVDQILGGLVAAHGRSIVHGALKPSNVMLVEPNQQGDAVKLIGLCAMDPASLHVSKVTLKSNGDSPPTPDNTTGNTLVSPTWASGESGPVGADRDVVAAGEILYRCVTGQHPNTISSVRDATASTGTIEQLCRSVLLSRDSGGSKSAAEFRSYLQQVQHQSGQPAATGSAHPDSSKPGLVDARALLGNHSALDGSNARRFANELVLLAVACCCVYAAGWWLANAPASLLRWRHPAALASSAAQSASRGAVASAAQVVTAVVPATDATSKVLVVPPISPDTANAQHNRQRRATGLVTTVPSPASSGTASLPVPSREPPQAISDLQRARNLLAADQVAQACAAGQLAASNQANDPAVWEFLGRCYMRLGQPKQARIYYKRYLDLAPNSSNAVFVHAIVDKEEP